MRRKVIALALALLALVSVLPPGAAAETPGRVVFESGAADANGVFTVTMKAYDMTFWGAQLALKYDPEVIQPVDADGDPARTGSDFGWAKQKWLNAVVYDYQPDRGIFEASFIISAADAGDVLNQNGEYVVGDEGLETLCFRFRRLKDGSTGLEIASQAKGEPYQKEFPDGMMVVNLVDNEFPVEVTFVDAEGTSESESYAPAAPEEPAKTADELLKEAVILKLDSHAAVVKGSVAAIYFGERAVTAYAHDNRTFVPVRFVGERLGATVGWENESRTVTVEKDGHRIEMAIGASTYTLDGAEKTLDAPAELTPSTDGNSRTMVPIRFVSEALGYQVEWDPERNLVIIVPQSLGWDPAGETEAQAMDDAVMKLALYSNFV